MKPRPRQAFTCCRRMDLWIGVPGSIGAILIVKVVPGAGPGNLGTTMGHVGARSARRAQCTHMRVVIIISRLFLPTVLATFNPRVQYRTSV